MSETIKIKYLPGSPELEQIDKGGCVDLYNYEDVTLQAGEFKLINLGIAIELPEGYDAIILPRSSTFKRYHILLVNSVGYIDNSYAGDTDYWLAGVYATEPTFIPKGTRCFQFKLVPCQPKLDFNKVNSLTKKVRNGFGSTGV